MMSVTRDQMVDALRTRGLRITNARRAVCAVLADSHGRHLTAPDIHRLTETAAGVALDQSTVYRTLDTLEESGLITHTHLGHSASAYHLADEPPHQHLVCTRCGETQGILESDLRTYLIEITERTGFHPDPTHFALSGVCRTCAGDTGVAADAATG